MVRKCHLDFNDVVFCDSVESFNIFVRWYLEEHGLAYEGCVFSGSRAKRVYWALFYKWKEGLV